MKHSGKKGKLLHDYLYQWTDEQDDYIKKFFVDRNPLVSNYYYGHSPTDTITNSCTKTDIHKRGVLERIVEPPL